MKWIRWQGFGAFVAVMVILFLFWIFFIDSFVERMIENTGTRIVGAKVELDDADVSLVPLGLTLTHLQVANPDEPMTNAVEVRRIAFSMDGINALRRKIVIEDMTMDGVQFSTPRAVSGAITAKAARDTAVSEKRKAKKFEKLGLPSFEVPDVKEILQKEELESVKQLGSLRSGIENTKKEWERRLKELPDKERFDEYKRRLKELKGAKGVEGILDAAAKARVIQKDLEKDLKDIKKAQKDFDAARMSLKEQLKQVAQAPAEDVRRLKNKYSLSPQGLARMSEMLLGPKIGRWVEHTLTWYKKIEPALQRAQVKKEEKGGPKVVKPIRARGVDVHFKERDPLPDFLIRRTKASVHVEAGNLAGLIRNITPDQDILGAPLMLLLSGDTLKGIESVKLHGTLNHVVPSKPSERVNVSVKGYETRDFTITDDPNLSVTLMKGLADFGLDGTLSGERLAATLTADLKSTEIKVDKPDRENLIAGSLGSALSNVSEFSFTADITGTVDEYDVRVTSDLDRTLKDAVGKLVQDQQARLESELNTAISEKTGPQLAELRKSIAGLDAIGDELTSRLTEGGVDVR
jgi:uncharacterized protein (TIGR03545 family)